METPWDVKSYKTVQNSVCFHICHAYHFVIFKNIPYWFLFSAKIDTSLTICVLKFEWELLTSNFETLFRNIFIIISYDSWHLTVLKIFLLIIKFNLNSLLLRKLRNIKKAERGRTEERLTYLFIYLFVCLFIYLFIIIFKCNRKVQGTFVIS